MIERDPCIHDRRHCATCHAKADAELARQRWWSGEPGLLLPWYCRDEDRALYGLEPDGLWNGPTPCGATITGIHESARADAEVLHRETCKHGCGEVRPHRPRDGVRIRDEDGPADTADVAADPYPEIASAEQARMADAESYANTVPEDGRWRPEQVNPSGRWRSKRRAIRELAKDLATPSASRSRTPSRSTPG